MNHFIPKKSRAIIKKEESYGDLVELIHTLYETDLEFIDLDIVSDCAAFLKKSFTEEDLTFAISVFKKCRDCRQEFLKFNSLVYNYLFWK